LEDKLALSLLDYQKRKWVEPDWIIPQWLTRQNTGFIFGEPKLACKSWLLLNMAWDLSEGKAVWDLPQTKGKPALMRPKKELRVVYFSLEDTENDIHSRVQMFFKAGRTATDKLWFVSKNMEMTIDNIKGQNLITKELEQAVKSGPIDLIAFDTARALHFRDENSSEIWAKIYRALNYYQARYNAATILTHHMIKSTAENYDASNPAYSRGSGHIFGGADAFINVVPLNPKETGAKIKKQRLHFTSRRSLAITPLTVNVDLNNGRATFDGFRTGRPKGGAPIGQKPDLLATPPVVSRKGR
jgi:RecA-family ATPase